MPDQLRVQVLVDEIGRGTSHRDGLAIAFAAAAHLLQTNKSKVIFATHMHELGSLLPEHFPEAKIKFLCSGVQKLSVRAVASRFSTLRRMTMVVPQDGTAEFDYQMKEGINKDSQGLLTARLAGLPESALKWAWVVQRQIAGETDSTTSL